MKRLLFVACILMAVAIVGCQAQDAEAGETSQAQWNNDLGKCGNACREYLAGHNHKVDEADYEGGVGLDLVVFVDEKEKDLVPDEVVIETKWDFSNQNGSSYVVAKYNLWNLFKKLKKKEE